MKFTVTRQAPVREITFGDVVIMDGKSWVVDEVRMGREGTQLFCVEEGQAVTRRKSFDMKPDETVTLEPGREDADAIISAFDKALSGHADGVTFTTKVGTDGSLSFKFDTGTTSSRVWNILIQP